MPTPPPPGPPTPNQSDHCGKKRNLPLGKSDRTIFGHTNFWDPDSALIPPPLSLIIPCPPRPLEYFPAPPPPLIFPCPPPPPLILPCPPPPPHTSLPVPHAVVQTQKSSAQLDASTTTLGPSRKSPIKRESPVKTGAKSKVLSADGGTAGGTSPRASPRGGHDELALNVDGDWKHEEAPHAFDPNAQQRMLESYLSWRLQVWPGALG